VVVVAMVVVVVVEVVAVVAMAMVVVVSQRVCEWRKYTHRQQNMVSRTWYIMSNILAKFCPRWCEVAPWIARPAAGMNASTVVV
jgi:hypothetical protein